MYEEINATYASRGSLSLDSYTRYTAYEGFK